MPESRFHFAPSPDMPLEMEKAWGLVNYSSVPDAPIWSLSGHLQASSCCGVEQPTAHPINTSNQNHRTSFSVRLLLNSHRTKARSCRGSVYRNGVTSSSFVLSLDFQVNSKEPGVPVDQKSCVFFLLQRSCWENQK